MYKRRGEKYSADAEIREAFSVFDRDSSGYITGKEILCVLSLVFAFEGGITDILGWLATREVMENLGETVTLAEVQEMVRAADTDGDGRISFAVRDFLMS
jgi:calmodulin